METISAFNFETSGDFYGSGPAVKPPTKFLYVGVASILIGLLMGIVGWQMFKSNETFQFLFGALGYVFTAVVPIVILQILRANHAKCVRNKDIVYDSFAGDILQGRYLKVVLAGLIAAALPLWVFFNPIASLAAR